MLKIKVFKAQEFTSTPPEYAQGLWLRLQSTIQAIYGVSVAASSSYCCLEEAYQIGQSLCQMKMSAHLFDLLVDEIQVHAKELYQRISPHSEKSDFFNYFTSQWLEYCRQTRLLQSVFMHLERHYVINQTQYSSIYDVCVKIFAAQLRLDSKIIQWFVKAFLHAVKNTRDGDGKLETSIMKAASQMLQDLGFYHETFEPQLLQHTSNYYSKQATKHWHEGTSVPNYLTYVGTRLELEAAFARDNLDSNTKVPLMHAVERELVAQYSQKIIEEGLSGLIESQNYAALKLSYKLLDRVNSLDALLVALCEYIDRVGSGIVTDPANDKVMIDGLLRLKESVDSALQAFDCYKAWSQRFAESKRNSFVLFINKRANKPAELIAKFMDVKLKGVKDETDAQLEAELDKVLILFKYVQGKDVFEAFYKKDLAKRLLLGKSASVDLERAMLQKLRREVGSEFTNKLEGMFRDMDISRETMQNFKSSKRFFSLPSMEFSVSVLTAAYWPSYPAVPMNLPDYMLQCRDAYQTFYSQQHSGRKLTWSNALGHCIVQAILPKGNKEFHVSVSQAIVLLQFNHQSDLAYSHLLQLTGLDDNDLSRTLQSLACGKVRILEKQPKGKEIAEGDNFSVNLSFAAALYRIRINAIQIKETMKEQADTNERVVADRLYVVDAAIVRVMKARKKLSLVELTAQVFMMCKFSMTADIVAARVSSLVDQDFLEYLEKEDVYSYVA